RDGEHLRGRLPVDPRALCRDLPPGGGRGGLDRRGGPRAAREVRRALGDLRAARDRPSRRQVVHRLPDAAETPADHPQDAEAEAREGPRVILPILTWPDPVLSQRAVPVTVFDDALRRLADDMLE